MLEKLLNHGNLLKKHSYLVVFFLLFIGFFVRTIGLSTFPNGLNQDEASIGYEAYSILSTGIDRSGNSFPIHFVSWGSGQNALYAYLSMPFISLFGLNVFSVRIINVLFSCITLMIFFLLFKLIFDKKKALVALAILAICPWSIMSARWGLESNIFPALFLLSVYFLIKSFYSSQIYFLLSFIFLGISLYSYGTSYLIVPLFLSFTLPYIIYTKKKSVKACLYGSAILLVISFPIALLLIINHFDLPQFQILGITIPRLDSNRTSVIFNLFTSDFLSTISQNILRLFNILISQSDNNSYNVIPSFGTIYGISLPFFIIGLYNVLKFKKYKNEIHHYIFCVWIICSILLGITSHVNINRLNILFIPMLYFVVLGIFDVNSALKYEYRNLYKNLLIGLYMFLFLLFIGHYFIFASKYINENYCSGLGDAIQFSEKINQTDTINITNNTVNMPYIYVCFYNKLDPKIFRSMVNFNDVGNINEFKEVNSLGRYTFGSDSKSLNTIYIMSEEELKFNKRQTAFKKDFGNYSVLKFNE